MNIRRLSALLLFFCCSGILHAQPAAIERDAGARGGARDYTDPAPGACYRLGSVGSVGIDAGSGGDAKMAPTSPVTISNVRFDGVGFRLDLSSIAPATIDIFDAGGARIASGRSHGNRTVRVVPRGAVPNGLYILRVSGGGASAVAKVAVVR